MSEIITRFTSPATGLGILGAAVAFIWSVTQFWLQRRRESNEKQFGAYHNLVRELVSPDTNGKMWIQRQAAVIFRIASLSSSLRIHRAVAREPQEQMGERSRISLAYPPHGDGTDASIHKDMSATFVRPEGTTELSPALQRWVGASRDQVPWGRHRSAEDIFWVVWHPIFPQQFQKLLLERPFSMMCRLVLDVRNDRRRL